MNGAQTDIQKDIFPSFKCVENADRSRDGWMDRRQEFIYDGRYVFRAHYL